MKVARLQTSGFIVGWVVLTPPTFKIIHPSFFQEDDQILFDDIDGVLPAHSSLIVECRVLDKKTLIQGAGFTACSPTDEFDLGVGIKKSAERAFRNLREISGGIDEDEVTEFYKTLLASPIGPVFRGDASEEGLLAEQELIGAIEDRLEGVATVVRYGIK